ncbi:DUF5983 family protein [Butyrivibrio sp. INlla21]|uniref:DUF5983 family protein n=1 Tax=Butyrivibrio sp. INlla21 TaxID=1520811 RepID=UPI0008F1E6AF|nr:hypothetical protein [Butyrivibrio sp. INlla21]SFU37286.1 hypothetical protein SAMN02910342_00299 [Butyrivibrio sp. INlla21]
MIGKYMDVCTSHLTQDTVDNLVIGNIPSVHAYDYEEGMFVVIPDEEHHLPNDLDEVFKYAKQNDITLIRFDRDGEEIDDLPTYDWRSPKERFLEQPAYFQQTALMETAMRIQDTADFLRYTGDISIDCDEMELLCIFTEMAREFEYKYYGTDRYTDDFLNFTNEVFREELIEKYGTKEN